MEAQTREIDGLSVTTMPLPAMRALRLTTKIGQLLAPVVPMLQGLKADDDVTKMAPALARLFAEIEGDKAGKLALEILATTTVQVDGRIVSLTSEDAINAAFTGRFPTMFAVIAFALEVNFGGFFGGNGKLAGLLSKAPA